MLLRYCKNEILAGLITSVAIIPEVVGFALVAKFDPISGLYTAFILGIIAALFGGRPALVSAAAGSMAVVAVHLSLSHGIAYVLWAGIFAGILQILFGVFRLGLWVRMIPQTAIFGFVNGLAVVIFLSQLQFFRNEGIAMWVIVALSVLIMFGFPKISKIVPAGLVAVIVLSLGVHYFGVHTRTIADLGKISGGLPHFFIPQIPFTWESVKIIFPYSVILALVGLIESLLTLSVMDSMQKTRGKPNQECIAQGAGNMICGFFGAMSGCVMIGQSMINATSGGRGRLSSMITAVAVLVFVVSIPDVIGKIPIGVLVGIMFVVAFRTFEWASISRLRSMKKSDIFVLICVTFITIFFDLAIAVIIGVIIAALVFAYENMRIKIEPKDEDHKRIYFVKGPLFFGSSSYFSDELFDIKNDPNEVVLDFTHARVMDSSGIEAIDRLTKAYLEEGKTLKLRHLSRECRKALYLSRKHCAYKIERKV